MMARCCRTCTQDGGIASGVLFLNHRPSDPRHCGGRILLYCPFREVFLAGGNSQIRMLVGTGTGMPIDYLTNPSHWSLGTTVIDRILVQQELFQNLLSNQICFVVGAKSMDLISYPGDELRVGRHCEAVKAEAGGLAQASSARRNRFEHSEV